MNGELRHLHGCPAPKAWAAILSHIRVAPSLLASQPVRDLTSVSSSAYHGGVP